jgi:ribose 5-phosphate isomerase A
MRLGLGTGRTASAFLDALEPRVRQGLVVSAVCTSEATEGRARSMGITILPDTGGGLDLDVDGADEVTLELDLIKGAGGAMVREKMVAERSRRFWVVADASKRVGRLGERAALPIEVLQFDWAGTRRRIENLCRLPTRLRGGPEPFISDNGNLILDADLAGFSGPWRELAQRLAEVPGVVGHGLFLGLATAAVISDGEGVEVLGDLEDSR